MNVLPDDPLEELFRCDHWACTLAVRHCLRRQREQDPHPARKHAKPMHAYCGSGECEQGRGLAVQYAGAEIAVPTKKRAPPRLDIVRAVEERQAQGEAMPRGKRAEPWPCCGSASTRHLKSCENYGTKSETKAAKGETKATRRETIRRAARKVARETPAQQAGLDEMSVADLLELRDQVQAELEAREEQLAGQLAAIRGQREEAA